MDSNFYVEEGDELWFEDFPEELASRLNAEQCELSVDLQQGLIAFIGGQVEQLLPKDKDVELALIQLAEVVHFVAYKVSMAPNDVRRALLQTCTRSDVKASTLLCNSQYFVRRTLWHIPQESDFSDGYCYLAVIKAEYEEQATTLLGRYPTFYALSQLDVTWFDDCVYETTVVTDDETRPVPALRGVSVFQALRGVAHNSMYFTKGSACETLVDIGPATYVSPLVPVFDTIGGVNRAWHVTTDNEKFSSSLPNGFCYEHLLKYKCRFPVAEELGSLPSVEDILRLPKVLFRPKHNLDRVLFVRDTGDEHPDAFTAHDVLTTLAHQVDGLDDASLGAFMIQRWGPRDISGASPPALADLVGTATLLHASSFNLTQAKMDSYVPPVREVVTQAVFKSSMDEWELSVDDGEVVEDVLTSMAEVLVNGSSNEVFQNASVVCAGKTLELSVLVRYATLFIGAGNSLRLWVRSFRRGEMCLRISGLLSDERNVALRQTAAARYFSGMRYVHLCFDTVRTYGRISSIRYVEKVFIRVTKAIRMTNTPMTRGLAYWLTNDDTIFGA